MLIAFVGGVGSGKSVSATKRIIDQQMQCFVNYGVKEKNVTRLKKEHIVKEEILAYTKSGKPISEKKVNWDFWKTAQKKYKNFHIVLDEVHNLVHSRQSMSKWNTLMSVWFSQIRKILGDSENTHIYLISQKLARIDVAFRDLLHMVIYCEKEEGKTLIRTRVWDNKKSVIKLLPKTWIRQYYFIGDNCVENMNAFMTGQKTYNARTYFVANPYFQYYDSYEMLGETAYL